MSVGSIGIPMDDFMELTIQLELILKKSEI